MIIMSMGIQIQGEKMQWISAVFPPLRNKKSVIGIIALFLLFGSGKTSALFPLIAQSHGFGWASEILVNIFGVLVFVTALYAGKLFDRWQRVTLIGSVTVNAVCVAGYILIPMEPGWLIVVRCCQTVAFTLGFIALYSTITLGLKSDRERTLGLGYASAVGPLAFVFTSIGEWIFHHYSDRLMFFFLFLLASLAVVVTFTILPEESKGNKTQDAPSNGKWWNIVDKQTVFPSLPLFFLGLPIGALLGFWLVAYSGGGGLYAVLAIVTPIFTILQGRLSTTSYPVIFGLLSLLLVGMVILVLVPGAYLVAAVFIGAGFSAEIRLRTECVNRVPDDSRRGKVLSTTELFIELGAIIGGLSGYVGRNIGYFNLFEYLIFSLVVAIVLTEWVRRRSPDTNL
jgi:MFS family permease